jgi:hypothetical protein
VTEGEEELRKLYLQRLPSYQKARFELSQKAQEKLQDWSEFLSWAKENDII